MLIHDTLGPSPVKSNYRHVGFARFPVSGNAVSQMGGVLHAASASQRSMKTGSDLTMLCQDVWSRGLQPYWCFRARGCV